MKPPFTSPAPIPMREEGDVVDAPLEPKRQPLLSGFTTGLFALYALEVVFGLILESRYSATTLRAHADVVAMQAGPFAILRAFHYWSSAILISGCLAALVWMLFARWFNGGHNRIWFATALLFLTSLFSQISGNVLPFDRHGVQTAVIESGVMRKTPIAGVEIQRLVLGGDGFNDSTVSRWHLGHISFIVLGLIAVGLFWSGAKSEKKSSIVSWAVPVFALLLAFAVRAPLGNPGTRADYGSFDAQVSWYTWPLHGSLNLFEKISPNIGWIGTAVIPGLFALFIVAAPFLARRLSAKSIQSIFAVFCLYFLIAGIGFGGRFASLVGNRDPVVSTATPKETPRSYDKALYARGRNLFNGNACSGCHGKDGRNPTEGPNLLGVALRRGTDPAWYQKFIANPTGEKPNTMMPSFPELKAEDTRAIAEFLINQK